MLTPRKKVDTRTSKNRGEVRIGKEKTESGNNTIRLKGESKEAGREGRRVSGAGRMLTTC